MSALMGWLFLLGCYCLLGISSILLWESCWENRNHSWTKEQLLVIKVTTFTLWPLFMMVGCFMLIYKLVPRITLEFVIGIKQFLVGIKQFIKTKSPIPKNKQVTNKASTVDDPYLKAAQKEVDALLKEYEL